MAPFGDDQPLRPGLVLLREVDAVYSDNVAPAQGFSCLSHEIS